MDDFTIESHFRHWENNNKTIKRVVLGTILMGYVLIANVLQPYVGVLKNKQPVKENIQQLKEQQAIASQKQDYIKALEAKMDTVTNVIRSRPWNTEKRELIRHYRRTPDATTTQQQQAADETIQSIGTILRDQIVEPMTSAITPMREHVPGLNTISDELDALEGFVADWEKRYLGKRWFSTLSAKESAMQRLTHDINDRLHEFSKTLDQEREKVELSKNRSEKELKAIRSNVLDEEKALEEINKHLFEVLPKWAHGLLTVDHIIQLLPLVFPAMIVYVMFLGFSLTKSYRIVLKERSVAQQDQHDTALGSMWTLLPRNPLGTAQTMLAYIGIIVVSWLLFEKSAALLMQWLSLEAEQSWLTRIDLWQGPVWLARALFVLSGFYLGSISLTWLRGTHNK